MVSTKICTQYMGINFFWTLFLWDDKNEYDTRFKEEKDFTLPVLYECEEHFEKEKPVFEPKEDISELHFIKNEWNIGIITYQAFISVIYFNMIANSSPLGSLASKLDNDSIMASICGNLVEQSFAWLQSQNPRKDVISNFVKNIITQPSSNRRN